MSVNGKDKADIFDEYFDVKSVMIDGVDVSECMYFDEYYSHTIANEVLYSCNSNLGNPYCETNPNCLFKQLQRLKEENGELKKTIEDNNPWNSCKNCNKDYRKALEEVREIADKKNYLSLDEALDDITNIINEVLK